MYADGGRGFGDGLSCAHCPRFDPEQVCAGCGGEQPVYAPAINPVTSPVDPPEDR